MLYFAGNPSEQRAGLGLLEVMMTAAVVALSAYAMAQYITNSARRNFTSFAQIDELALKSKLTRLFQNDILCTDAIGGLNVTRVPTSGTTVFDPARIRQRRVNLPEPIVVAEAGQRHGRYEVRAVDVRAVTQIPGSVDDWILTLAVQLHTDAKRGLGASDRTLSFTVPVKVTYGAVAGSVPFSVRECRTQVKADTFVEAYFRELCLTSYTDSNVALCGNLKNSVVVAAKWEECEAQQGEGEKKTVVTGSDPTVYASLGCGSI
ncbi:MAG: hypothetical protein AB7P04_10915 [Bacteriovoracia bacterium]